MKFLKNRDWFTFLSARLSRRIVIWVCIGLVVIEAIILLPSQYRRQQELLLHLEQLTNSRIEAIAQTHKNISAQQFLNFLQPTHSENPLIVGAAIYRLDGKRIGSFGETPQLSYQPDQSKQPTQKQTVQNTRYETAQMVRIGEQNYWLAVRQNATSVKQEMVWFLWRVGSLVMVIAVFVAVVTLFVLKNTVIEPIFYLQRDFIRAGEAVQSDREISGFFSQTRRYPDELQDAIAAFQKMYEQVRQAIAERKQAETQLETTNTELANTLTELRATQSQLIQKEKLDGLATMAAGIAHEINNANNAIYGNIPYIHEYTDTFLEALDRSFASLETSETVEEIQQELDLEYLRKDLPNLLREMRDNAEKIRRIVEALQSFAKLNEAEFKRTDLHAELDTCLLLLNHRLNANLQIEKQYGSISSIQCCPAQINQVFFCLLDNALDAIAMDTTTDSGKITIATQQPNSDWVRLSIKDNGIGISQEIQDKIFDPFFTNKPVGQGTGLGLFSCYQNIVEGHGGTISCHSQPQQGSEFIVELPVEPLKE
jgi:signal transduction histidine kinase